MGESGSGIPGRGDQRPVPSPESQRRGELLKALRAADTEVGEYTGRVLTQALRRLEKAAAGFPTGQRQEILDSLKRAEDANRSKSPARSKLVGGVLRLVEPADRGAAKEARSLIACADRASALLLSASTELESTELPTFLRSLTELNALINAGSSVKGSYQLKLCLLGEGGVGKTSLIRRYVTNAFSEDYLQTLGTRVSKKELVVPDPSGQGVAHTSLMIWDVIGHEKLPSLVQSYLHGVHGVLLVCSLADRRTLKGLDYWTQVSRPTDGETPHILAGNKSDLADREVTDKEFADLGESFACDALPTSAKSGVNVEPAFSMLVRLMLKRRAQAT